MQKTHRRGEAGDGSYIPDLWPMPPTSGAQIIKQKYKFMSDTLWCWTKCVSSLKRGRISKKQWRLFFMCFASEMKFFLLTGFLPDEKIKRG